MAARPRPRGLRVCFDCRPSHGSCYRCRTARAKEHEQMAYVVEKAGLHYAVIYEGVNPITGSERRRWYRCADRAEAGQLARQLGARRARARRAGSTMTLADYLLGRWLPTREAALSPDHLRPVRDHGRALPAPPPRARAAPPTPRRSARRPLP